jgi:Flp pilus assembly protein TadD
MGKLELGTGNYQEAAKEFELALQREPTTDEAYRGLAVAYEKMGRPDDAERTYRRAIALRAHYWATYNWLGAYYYRQARFPEASAMFRQVISLAPDSVRGYSNLGASYLSRGTQRPSSRPKNQLRFNPRIMGIPTLVARTSS